MAIFRARSFGRPASAFLVLIAISTLVRLLLIANFRARGSWDTQSYVDVARCIANLNFTGYDGRRTPVYPTLLVLAGMDWDNVRLIQSLLGIAIASMLFVTAWYRTHSAKVSFIVGLLGSLALTELLYEQIIYSETICTFWLMLSVLAYARIELAERATSLDYTLLGVSAALAGMTRPMFLFVGPLYSCLMLGNARRIGLRNLREVRIALVLAPTLALALGWSAFNKHTVNYFGVTTTTGYNLSNHSGAFMELAPARYSQIADIYLRYRSWQIRRMGSQTMTIWYAEGEIKRKTGLSTVALSKQLTKMSLEMFAQHPLLYLESVSYAWARFWGGGFYDFIRSYKVAVGGGLAYAVLLGLGTLQLAVNAAFLMIAAYSFARWWMGRGDLNFDLGVIAIVLTASVVQALLEYGENVRYLAPLVPLTIYVVTTSLWRAISSITTRREAAWR